MKKLTIITILSLFFISCNKNAAVAFDSDAEKILGKWEWVKTEGGWGGTQTPETSGTTHQLFFQDEVVEYYFNDTLAFTQVYELSREKPDYLDDTISVIIFGNREKNRYSFSDENTLIIDPTNYITDVGWSEYKRD